MWIYFETISQTKVLESHPGCPDMFEKASGGAVCEKTNVVPGRLNVTTLLKWNERQNYV